MHCLYANNFFSSAASVKSTISSFFINLISKMASIHLAQGSEKPPKNPSKIRLYGMKFCPFVQRVRFVLSYKNIPHELIYVNLKNKPDWFLEISPEGKVPVLEIGDEILLDSLKIVDYLDVKYPEPPLRRLPNDSEMMEKFSGVNEAFANAVYKRGGRTFDSYINDLYDSSDVFEKELKTRKSPYFGGDSPGYLDFMIWPWSERSKVPHLLFDEPFSFPKERFSNLVLWRQAMKEQDIVKGILIAPERHAELVRKNIEFDINGTPIDYDSV